MVRGEIGRLEQDSPGVDGSTPHGKHKFDGRPVNDSTLLQAQIVSHLFTPVVSQKKTVTREHSLELDTDLSGHFDFGLGDLHIGPISCAEA